MLRSRCDPPPTLFVFVDSMGCMCTMVGAMSPRSRIRLLNLTVVVGVASVALTGCAFLPGLGGVVSSRSGSADESELVGTTWAGIDSDGDSWELEFQRDGTLGLTYEGGSYDDPSDVWSHTGSTVTMHVAFDDGAVDMVGTYAGLRADMETQGTYPGGEFTLTLAQR